MFVKDKKLHRKKQKQKPAVKFLSNIEIDDKIICQINKIEQQIKHWPQLDLNQQVKDLFGGVAEYK